MKTLTALFLLLSLVLPAGLVSGAAASPARSICTMVEDSGSSCCEPTVTHCCCDAAPLPPAPPEPPQPHPSSSSAAKDIAVSLPALLVLAELPRLSDFPPHSSCFSDGTALAMAPPVRLCVLRCRLLL